MKKPIYYAISRRRNNPVMAITSEKGNRRWYGRTVQDHLTTNGTKHELLVVHENVEVLIKLRDSIINISQDYYQRRQVLNKQVEDLYKEEANKIADLCRNVEQAKIKPPV